MAKVIFVTACLFAIIVPFMTTNNTATKSAGNHDFPTEFEGRRLNDLGLSDREKGFLADFPGQIGRFSDGDREIIIRRVTEATRKLHPAVDCFKAVGFITEPLPVRIDEAQHRWSCFSAVKEGDKLRVCERIEDKRGGVWTDVSSWYWSAWGSDHAEWWAYTVAERWTDQPQR